jgi:hypothetical protein
VAREWIVTWALLTAGETDILDRKKREQSEQLLNGIARRSWQNENDAVEIASRADWLTPLHGFSEIDEIAAIYERLGQIRNDLLHAGKNKSARKSTKLEQAIQQIGGWLDQIVLPAGVGP